VRLSVIGLGTWQFGSRAWGYGADYALGEARAITRRALELGINVVDTAEAYARGRSEKIVGRAVAPDREHAFLATKFTPLVPTPNVVERHAAASAFRLGVSTIDLYQLHWPNPLYPLARTMDGFRRVLDSGLAAHVGLSNCSLETWWEAESQLGRPLLSNQVRYNLLDRRPEEAMLSWAAAKGRVVIAYSPLAQGVLSGRYRPGRRPGGLRALSPAGSDEGLRRVQPVVAALEAVGHRYGATPSQVALAWTVRTGGVVAIPGASSVAQLEQNAAAADLVLDEEDDARLDAASRAFVPLRAGPAALAGSVSGLARNALADRLGRGPGPTAG
jgi:aryl-alcohol dehydrogenase-like predicted oxidoreductase